MGGSCSGEICVGHPLQASESYMGSSFEVRDQHVWLATKHVHLLSPVVPAQAICSHLDDLPGCIGCVLLSHIWISWLGFAEAQLILTKGIGGMQGWQARYCMMCTACAAIGLIRLR